VGAGSLSEGVVSPVVGVALLGVEPLCGEVTLFGVDVSSALTVDRGDNETKAATPSAMAEPRRAPCVMATSF
jgi:hypothetical protein